MTILQSVLCFTMLLFAFTECSRVIEADHEVSQARTFLIDYDNNTFLMDGKPFRFIAGSFHYFRSHPDSWQRKLRTMRAAGLNAVTTYVEWSLHNPKDGVFVWDGIADLEKFIQLAEKEDLYVILRPGPYICAERDMGGLPYWLLTKYPNIKLRTYDIDYLSEIRIWYSQLMVKMEKFLYGNGGPIIMVQVENEYGSFHACDRKYKGWLADETNTYVKDKAILFTTDGPSFLRCGSIDNVFPTIDFGSGGNISKYWQELRKYRPTGPLVNSEFYPGWLTHWQEPMQRVSTDAVVKTLKDMLDDGANVNFYMFYGGTNFGFTAGANDGGPGKYNADVTSYDYDAPMDESGDPTEKYHAIREVIAKYLPMPDIPVPQALPKHRYGDVVLKKCCSLLSQQGRKHLSDGTVQSSRPLTFEALDQNSGFVLYETLLPLIKRDPALLKIPEIHDRAYVYTDGILIGVLSRENQIYSVPIFASSRKLQILVESQGRINYNIPNDFKGIIRHALLDNTVLSNWNITRFPLDNYGQLENLIVAQDSLEHSTPTLESNANILLSGPAIFYGEFEITDQLFDTYLDPTGWGKGVVFINGFNLGRYWPLVGPQITLYVPKEVLKTGINRIVLIEYQRKSDTPQISLTNVPNLDGFRW